MKLKCFKADLHIHTCLSPCAEAEMMPNAIVKAAKTKGLDVIGICDHNSAENVRALVRSAEGEALVVLGGLEVISREEVHVLGLFDSSANDGGLQAMQRVVYENLPGENDLDAFGEQLVCGEDDSIVGRNTRLLVGGTTLTLEQVVKAIHDLDGVAIASHVDRERSGIVGQLGFVPEGLALDALELSRRAGGREQWGAIGLASGLPFVWFSDAHSLDGIGAASTSFEIESPCVDEIKKALRSQDGRRVVA